MKILSKRILVLMFIFSFVGNLAFPGFNFSNKAAEVSACVPENVQVCHRTESSENPWVEIEISIDALSAHLAQNQEDFVIEGGALCPPPPPPPVCGNQTLEAGEECDDGNIINGDGCSASCTIEQPQCIAEGESGAVVPEGPECCQGLTQIGCDQPDLTGECSGECVGAFYCTMCGNGVCGLGENKCNCPQDCGEVIIYGYKVVCDSEQYLPNWGDGQDVSIITEQVINDFVAQNSQYCHLESGWDFEWGRNGEAQKQNGDYIGFAPDGNGWNDFDNPTGATPAKVILSEDELNGNNQIWVREVLKQGYIPFSNPPGDLQNSTSAEMYCYQDVLNYDNYDYILNPQLGEEYYCVAFNALEETEPYCELELTKTDNIDPVDAGAQIVYHLNLKNTGTANCTGGGVRVKDVFDQNTSYVSSSKTPEEVTSTYIKWNFGILTPGEEENIDLTMQVSQDTQCGTILENKAKYWSDQTGWGEFVIEQTTVDCDDQLTIYASKIVCQSETDLPNWGDGGPNITAKTAQSFVEGNQNCHLASGWNFEWAFAGTPNPGDNIIGPAGSGWTTFGPTDSNGIASVNISTTSGDRIWLREIMKQGYIPFSGDTSAPRDNVGAELYCHEDVLNYDNYDYILNPQLDESYYCVAFNALTPVESYCGDGILNGDEQCDDGNIIDGDGCSASCTIELPICDPEEELIVNNGFELPLVSTPQLWNIFDSIAGNWTVEWRNDIPAIWNDVARPEPAHLELQAGVNGWLPYEGIQYAELDTDWDGPAGSLSNEPASVKIYQDISTIPGENYNLSFYFSPRPSTAQGDNVLEVKWNGNILDTISQAGSSNNNWSQRVYSFTANTSTTRLEFADLGVANSLGTFVDSVSLRCQPYVEPGTSTLIVIDHVIGGTATSGDFTVYVTGTNTSPASFPGEDVSGTYVVLDPGAYSVSQSNNSNYITSFSADCSSTIMAGETKTCTIINIYKEQPEISTLIVIDHVIGGSATSGAFTVSVAGNSPVPTSFPGQEAPGTPVILGSGSYSVNQSSLSNYTTSYSDNCSSTILAGETKTCTITNNYHCIPIKTCSQLECNQTDSCGNYCGGCGGCIGPNCGGSPFCGDGIVNGSEQCDKSAGVTEGYTCTASCILEKNICNMDLNVMMVMDVSGSMGYDSPTRLSMAKTAANSFIDNLRSGDQSGLVSFSWTSALNKKLSNDHASTKSIIAGLVASGATNIGEAIDKANKELISATASPSIARIEILLTDGRANQPNGNGSNENPADIALALAKSLEAAENGIMIFTIGLGSDVNTKMLSNMAKNTGGKYYFAPTGNDLNGIFNQIASETCKDSSATTSAFIEPPISIFNARLGDISSTGVTVSWYTNIPATSRVVYGEQRVSTPGESPTYGYNFSTEEQDIENKVIFHSVIITGLAPDKTYYWRPISRGSPEVLGEEELIFVTEPLIPGPVLEEEQPVVEIEEGSAEGTSTEISQGQAQGQQEEHNTSSPERQKFLGFLSKGLASVFNTIGKTNLLIVSIIVILFVLYFISEKRKKAKK
ncbi:MAG: VWA domain-containing protein [Candidatus Nealsonbacteria bacterium]|nr:VWA domain-containing protein [Candidatus Nealsonbacteria bacterium]